MSFHDKTVLITGATGSVGPAVVLAFASAGANIVLAARSADKMDALVREQGLDAGRALAYPTDVTDPGSAQACVQAARDAFGRVDVLVNLAGGFRGGKLLYEMDDGDWQFLMDLNARSVFNMCRAVAPVMLAQSYGKIVNVGTKQALSGAARSSIYGASKAAVLRMTESLSSELCADGINVNAIIPSTIDTPDNRKVMPKSDFSRWATPAQVAAVIKFLASDAADAVHGAFVPVAGKR